MVIVSLLPFAATQHSSILQPHMRPDNMDESDQALVGRLDNGEMSLLLCRHTMRWSKGIVRGFLLWSRILGNSEGAGELSLLQN